MFCPTGDDAINGTTDYLRTIKFYGKTTPTTPYLAGDSK